MSAKLDTLDAARPWLSMLVVIGFLVTVSGYLSYAYPETLGSWHAGLSDLHGVLGDVCFGAAAGYVFVHLFRVWRMRRLLASRWTGYSTAGLFLISAGTGIAGQVERLVEGSWLYLLHSALSVLLVLLACVHGAWGFRRRLLSREAGRVETDDR
ncbi:MAG: hypothetical protein HYV07_29915 [Deltaproteobacteria bacterium]|nr:hypothetical protein [Deltaproteobacteria bacterium]